MDNIIVKDSFWNIFPEAQINVLIVKDVNNTLKDAEVYENMLNVAKNNALKYLPEDNFSDNVIIQQWRNDYTKFKKKKGARSSIEALLKRVAQGKGVGSINPLVDIYNSISMSYGVPVGGEDMDTIVGDLTLGVAEGGEAFYPLGDDNNEPALSGEVIYADDKGAVCRCLNWRDGQRTMLTEDTHDAVLFIESTRPETHEQANNAIRALQTAIKDNLQVESMRYQLSKNDSAIKLL
ncbi:B3/4 domain-containing protein [Weissella kandleri]|uniref:B3/B4 domain-containing protein n=1 Tax=Weissella kandleri TaxID=1616 RepID=UPI00387EB60D